ncbi:MAG: hypothetical protein PHU63_02725 [Candidatus ainarchaeum sp.]|nr:hypothetical protein [Candidatus ainarchaeum sp.]
MDIDNILEEMKNNGFKTALLTKDGKLFKSNFQIEEPSASVLSSFFNVSDAMLRQVDSEGREFELQLEDSILVGIPISNYYLVSYTDSRDKKKTIREYAERIKGFL